MGAQGREAPFSKKTSRIVAGRAGYRCAIPDCNALTMGPGLAEEAFVITGNAAHIFAGSHRGPRGTGGLTVAERQRPANGIWLCATHHAMIDKERGADYPAPLLLSYKRLAEHRAALEMNYRSAPVGWIHKLTIRQNVLFSPNQTLYFGKTNLLTGANGLGKTALYEWVAGVFDLRISAKRWVQIRADDKIEYELEYYLPEPRTVAITLTTSNAAYVFDGSPVPVNPDHFDIVCVRTPNIREDWDDIGLIAKTIGIDETLLISVLQNHPGAFTNFFRNPTIERESSDAGGVRRRLHVDHGTHNGISFAGLSGGERVIMILDIAIGMAGFMSRYRPTLLILDSSPFGTLDDAHTQRYLDLLSSSSHNFQSIVERAYLGPNIRWNGWLRTDFSGPRGRSLLSQE